MTTLTKEEASVIASKYFKLLIDRHSAEGFSSKVIEKKENENMTNFYLEFSNAKESFKYYKILAPES
ncbi:MAG: hypothetical protein V3V16_06000 [Melioribacteraceae bacterium]